MADDLVLEQAAPTSDGGAAGRAPVAAPRPGVDARPAVPPPAPPRRSRTPFVVLGLVLLLAVAFGSWHWFATRNIEETDDAFIDGDLVQISPRVAGPVVELHMTDNQKVRQGDLLLRIDARDYQVALESARAALAAAEAQAATARANIALTTATTAASLAQATSGVDHAKAWIEQSRTQVAVAEAELVRARQDVERYRKLVRDDFASRQRAEQAEAQARSADAQFRAAQHAVKVAEAQLGEAEGKLAEARTGPQLVAMREAELRSAEAQVAAQRAAVEQAELNLSYTAIKAPHDGVVTKRAVREGDVVQKDQTLGTIVFGTPWVTANFKETQLRRMRSGQRVEIIVDAYSDHALKGHVDSVQRGTGARFSLLPPENATGNFVKVVQRVPVKIVFDEKPPPELVLGLGMSVVPEVDVASGPAASAQSAAN